MKRDKGFYSRMLHAFVSTSSIPDTMLYADDPLTHYLVQTMKDDDIRKQVLSDEVSSRIFIDSMMQLVCVYLQKANYHAQRCAHEQRQIEEVSQWSLEKRRDSWQVLLQQIDKRYASQGFDARFYQHELVKPRGYVDNALWQTLLNDWQYHLETLIAQNNQVFLEKRSSLQSLLLRNNLQSAPVYIRQHGISKDNFFQSWALMGGRWNAHEYERLQSIVALQKKYPVLNQVAKRMGRIADELGRQSVGYTSGKTEQMEHASHSDITGVTLGSDLGSLLPLEVIQFSDEDMEDLFFQKYVSNRLQTFSYQSASLHAARSLDQRRARPHGPMVVCMDTSGSMDGLPFQIALSLMMNLAEMCEKEKRSCELIAFSVFAKPIDVMDDRTKLLQFFTSRATGDTDARRMLGSLFDLFSNNQRYAGADVLWITDFRIPLADSCYLAKMESMRKEGTHFYGLQIGIAENHWISHFDEMFHIYDYQ